jgi:polysaccharide biosynthesis protein PslH
VRLLVLSSWYPVPPTHGSKLRAWHLLRELTSRHEVTLLTFAEPGEAASQDQAALDAICREVRIVTGNPHKPSAPLSWRGYFGQMPRSYAQTFNETMAAHVADAAARADAIVAFQIGTALYLSGDRGGVAGVFDEAEVTTIHDGVDHARGRVDRWRRHLAWRKFAGFTRRLVSSTERTTVVSPQERACLERAGCDLSRVAVVPNGVAAEYLRVDVPRVRDTLIYSGSVTYSPNRDAVEFFAADILPLIRAVRPDVTMTVTGSTGDVRIDHLVANGLTFAGFVPDIASRVAATAVCVVPLRHGGGTRLKILEAMALGTPVVSTRKGAEGLDVRDGEHLLLADHPDAFARRVTDLLEHPEQARRLAANARRLVAERYTWARIGQTLEGVIDDAVEIARSQRRSA